MRKTHCIIGLKKIFDQLQPRLCEVIGKSKDVVWGLCVLTFFLYIQPLDQPSISFLGLQTHQTELLKIFSGSLFL